LIRFGFYRDREWLCVIGGTATALSTVGTAISLARIWRWSHMKQPEYRKGPEALESFERHATAILQASWKKRKRQA
jgi:hypothetical protein